MDPAEQDPLVGYSVVKFPEEKDDECVENVEFVSSTWVTPKRTRSFWPPASIPAARAGRMATLHTKPDPATWQCLPIIFIRTYRTLSRARKNVKLVADGEDAQEDNSTDYAQPRKRKQTQKLIYDNHSVDAPLSPKEKIRRRTRELSSESEDSNCDVPDPVLDTDALQKKVDRAIARRQVEVHRKPGKKTISKAKTLQVVTSPKSSSGRDRFVKKDQNRSLNRMEEPSTSKQLWPPHPSISGVKKLPFPSNPDVIHKEKNWGSFSRSSDPLLTNSLVSYDSDNSSGNFSGIHDEDSNNNTFSQNSDDNGTHTFEFPLRKDQGVQTINVPASTSASQLHTPSAATAHQLQQYEQGEQLVRMMKQVLVNQRRILSYVVPESEHTQNDYSEMPHLPLSTEEEYDEFEEYLDLKSQKQLVVKYFISLYREGMDEAKYVGKLLPEVISNALAKCISWEGTEGTKIPFVKSKINNAIRLAVLRNFASSDLSKAEQKIQRWFNTSAQRN